jgi:hypothetical protein
MKYLASIKPPGATAFRIVRFDKTGAFETIGTPPPGRSWHRPVSNAQGDILWWETSEGGSHDLPEAGARLVVNGERRPAPTGWTLWGHPEWGPWGWDGEITACAQDPKGVWRLVELFDFGVTWGDFGIAETEPSWAADGRIATIENKRTVHVGVGGWSAPTGVDQMYDPFVSPDGRRCVVLGRVGGLWGVIGAQWRLDVLDLDTGQWRKLIGPSWGENVSAARWVDNRTVVTSRLRRTDQLRWDAWRIDVDTGKASRIVAKGAARDALGTIEYVAPAEVAS